MASSKRTKTHRPQKSTPPQEPHPDPTTTSAPTRKSDRKRKILFTVAAATTSSSLQRHWTDDETLSLLRHLIDFKSTHNGSTPTPTHLMGPFFSSIKPSLPADVNPRMLLNKVNLLRRRYKESPADTDTPIHHLSSKIWAPTDSDPKPEPASVPVPVPPRDSGYPYLTMGVKESLDRCGVPLETLRGIDAMKAAALESKWKWVAAEELRLWREQAEIERKLCGLLVDAATKEG